MNTKIVVTGLGLITPIGATPEAFWNTLRSGIGGPRPITLFDTSKYQSHLACEIADFDPKSHLGAKGLRYFDRVSLLLVSAAKLTIDHSRIASANYPPTDLGTSVGSTYGSIHSISTFDLESLREGPDYVSPMEFPNTVLNAPAGRIAIQLQMTGFNTTISNGETSALDAISYARDFLRLNRIRAVLAGGTYALTPDTFWGSDLAHVLARKAGNAPEGCRPFSSDCNGVVLGEGAATMMLERLDDARRRGASVYGEISGYGTSFCAAAHASNSLWIEASSRTIRLALEDAGIEPKNISWILTSGNSGDRHDVIEAQSLRAVFGRLLDSVPTGAIKSMVGECLDATPAMQIAAALGAMEHREIPACLNGQLTSDGEIALVHSGEDRRGEIEHVLITAQSFTGNNSAMIVSRLRNNAARGDRE